MLADHARGGGQDRVGVEAPGGLLAELIEEAQPGLVGAHRLGGAQAFGDAARACRDLAQQQQFVRRPVAHFGVVDVDHGDEASLLDDRLVDEGPRAAALQGIGCVACTRILLDVGNGGEFAALQAVDEGSVIAQPQRAGQCLDSRRVPVAHDGQSLGLGIDRSVPDATDPQYLAHHAGSLELHVGRVVEITQPVGETNQQLAPPLGLHPLRGLHHDRHDSARLAALVDHGRIVEIHPDRLGPARAMKRQSLVLVGEGSTREADLHDVVVEVGDLRPALAHLAAQQLGMAAAREARIGIVVEHDAVLAPQQDDRQGRMDQEADGGLEALRPVRGRPERRRPIEGRDARGHLARTRRQRQVGQDGGVGLVAYAWHVIPPARETCRY